MENIYLVVAVTISALSAIAALISTLMLQKKKRKYYPHVWADYMFPPGDTLLEVLEHCGVTKEKLAERMGWSSEYVSDIIAGKTEITEEVALNLEEATGIESRFWLDLEHIYREETARLIRIGRYRPPN